MMTDQPDARFRDEAAALEAAYLSSDDPMEQSGFHGGRQRWLEERSPIVDAINKSGTFLDVGCANGLLAQDVVVWAGEIGFVIEPFGVDLGAGLIGLARDRHEPFSGNFWVGDAWEWAPSSRWTFVYSLLDLSPEDLWCVWLRRIHSWVEPGGRLIVGSYGSRSRGIRPADVARVLDECGYPVAGESAGDGEPVTRFAWVNV